MSKENIYLEELEWVDRVRNEDLRDTLFYTELLRVDAVKRLKETCEELCDTKWQLEEALSKLKDMETRVLDLDEVKQKLPFHLWVEDEETGAILFPVVYEIDPGRYEDITGGWTFDFKCNDDSDYNKTWRFWNKKPTLLQRQQTKWKWNK